MTNVRTNPDTCQHKVIIAFTVEGRFGPTPVVLCVSCEAELSLEYHMQFHWRWDHAYDTWVYTGPCDCDL